MRSIQARYTIITTMLLLVILALVGTSIDMAIRYRIQDDGFGNAERVASQWSALVRIGNIPDPIPATAPVDLVQLVNSHGVVVNSSRQAIGMAPISTSRPPADDRFQQLTEGSVMVMAIRVSPAADSPVVYAGLEEPAILHEHHLEYFIAAGVLILLALAAWMTWCVVGRTLRPVAAIRARMSEITVSDLSLRVPIPPGEDEIALLARTANQTLTRLEEAVEQQRRFASTASHELRTPIAGLRVQLEEALLYPDDVDPRDTIRGALTASGRLEAIVNDLLQLARLRAADPAPQELIDLGALVTEEAAQGTGMPVRVQVSARVHVRGSRIQLIRVVGNLLSNARRHADSRVEVSVGFEDGKAVVAVVDDGAGIAPADRERVFERFTRLDDGRLRDSGGSGLGLAISRDIAHAHQGTLLIEDSPRGARFVLRLPAEDARPLGTDTEVQLAGPGKAAPPSRRAAGKDSAVKDSAVKESAGKDSAVREATREEGPREREGTREEGTPQEASGTKSPAGWAGHRRR
ncbi:HAMP domain-containing sensor histidine kinase [Streptosporangium sp. NPDC002524]|uniref:sensor histidine kinase n=1 Tax=Streptosporangium sp. NPDC002524 TaxID=3154537 RepID=UPI00332EA334